MLSCGECLGLLCPYSAGMGAAQVKSRQKEGKVLPDKPKPLQEVFSMALFLRDQVQPPSPYGCVERCTPLTTAMHCPCPTGPGPRPGRAPGPAAFPRPTGIPPFVCFTDILGCDLVEEALHFSKSCLCVEIRCNCLISQMIGPFN